MKLKLIKQLHVFSQGASMHEYLVKDEEEPLWDYGCRPEERTIQQHLEKGVINLDKPPGPTSHEVTAWVKRILGVERAGHGGTLEPHRGGGVILRLQGSCP